MELVLLPINSYRLAEILRAPQRSPQGSWRMYGGRE